jgi:hypothetical protein
MATRGRRCEDRVEAVEPIPPDPKVSASHSDRSRRGEWSARIARNRRWLALGRSITEPSTATACTSPNRRTLLIGGSEPTTSALSHANTPRQRPGNATAIPTFIPQLGWCGRTIGMRQAFAP